MSAYEILQFVNQTLQGQFRKYPSVALTVASKCVSKARTLEEAEEMFNDINLAVARILSTDRIEDLDGDTPEIVEYAEKLNNHINIERLWLYRKVIRGGTKLFVKHSTTGEEQVVTVKVNQEYKKRGWESRFVEINNRQTWFNEDWRQKGTSGANRREDYWTIERILN